MAEIKNNTGVYEHTLKTPLTYENKTHEKFTFNFDKLTGKDYIDVENEMANNNEYMIIAEASRGFQYRIAAKAAEIGSDILIALPASDFSKIVNAARRFLNSTE
ncbi:MAG: phage tail assembly protein [Oscillospiraceae bacterium]|nr:phage tail assembly protein [Oscillospiraceae bacterium]